MAEAVLAIDPLGDAKEQALREFARYTQKIWDDYGVLPANLTKEVETWYWLSVPIKKGNKIVYRDELHWRGLGDTISAFIERKRLKMIASKDIQELSLTTQKAHEAVHLAACYLWAKEECPGPTSSLSLVKQANKAESLAKYLDKMGKDINAHKQRRKAAILRRIAAGEKLELPKRAAGAIDKVREAYAKIDSDGKVHQRKEYIDAGLALGINPGTCAVQYARWKREKK